MRFPGGNRAVLHLDPQEVEAGVCQLGGGLHARHLNGGADYRLPFLEELLYRVFPFGLGGRRCRRAQQACRQEVRVSLGVIELSFAFCTVYGTRDLVPLKNPDRRITILEMAWLVADQKLSLKPVANPHVRTGWYTDREPFNSFVS